MCWGPEPCTYLPALQVLQRDRSSGAAAWLGGAGASGGSEPAAPAAKTPPALGAAGQASLLRV